MTMQQISVTRALVELKRLDDRITKAISGGVFVSRAIGRGDAKKAVSMAYTLQTLGQKIQSSFDSVDSLLRNREMLKSAIVMSNATTKVTILNKEVSVAEAIELKKTLPLRTMFLNALRQQSTHERTAIDKANTALDAEIETSVNTLYGADAKKIDADTLKGVSEVKKTQKEQSLLDPCLIENRISAVEADILNLSTELDFVLSESNAKTVLAVQL